MTNCRLVISPIPRAEAEAALATFGEGEEDPLTIAVEEVPDAADTWRLLVYLDAQHSAEAALEALRRRGIGSGDPVVETVPQTDWVRQSLQGLAPVRAGRFLIHGSHDRDSATACAHAIEIDAGLAFGTGHHATTKGCLIALDHLLKRVRPQRVIDVGSGSGVLAIAAAKSSTAAVRATDIDAEAVRVAEANSRTNEAGARLRIHHADGVAHREILAEAPFDVVLANILAGPLIHLAGPISRLTARGGSAILSGLTRDQATAVAAAYRLHGFVYNARIDIGEWSILVLKKPAARRKRERPRGWCRRALRSRSRTPG